MKNIKISGLAYPMKRQSFYYLMTVLTVSFTVICFKNPELNHNALHFFAIPCVAIVVYAVSNIFKMTVCDCILELDNQVRHDKEAEQDQHLLVRSRLFKLAD